MLTLTDLLPHPAVFPESPTSERIKAQPIYDALRELADNINRFEDALTLFNSLLQMKSQSGNDHAREMQAVRWLQICADSGALTIWNFEKAMQALAFASNDEGYRALIKHRYRKEGFAVFKTSFPGFIALRYAAAHATEHSLDPERHAVTDTVLPGIVVEAGATVMAAGMSGRKIWRTVDRAMVEYELSVETLIRLKQIAKLLSQSLDANAPA